MPKVLDNNVLRDMTAEEIARADANREQDNIILAQMKADKDAYDALKASAKAKLIAGEALTEDEANTIVL